jgi:hypothetical protein
VNAGLKFASILEENSCYLDRPVIRHANIVSFFMQWLYNGGKHLFVLNDYEYG